jgi:hypothetical protein
VRAVAASTHPRWGLVALAAAIVLGEALRQTGGLPQPQALDAAHSGAAPDALL